MLCLSGEEIQSVGQEGKHGAQGAFGAAGAAGEIENQGVAEGGADATTQGGEGGMARAILADQLSESGYEAGGDGQRGLGGDVAGGEAGAAGGEDQGGAGGGCAQGGRKLIDFVGEGEGLDDLGASVEQDTDDGRAGEIRLGASRAAITDGDDDGSAASERGGGRHISRIDADARNRAEDEKIDGPASFWSGDLSRRRNLRRGTSVTD